MRPARERVQVAAMVRRPFLVGAFTTSLRAGGMPATYSSAARADVRPLLARDSGVSKTPDRMLRAGVPGDAMVAALFVDERGVYRTFARVDMWNEGRDARRYPGPHPVVAHPPCSRWCRLAGLVEARWGHKRGDDGGCFASALDSVRRWGGVLEHPAYSDAWGAFGLPRPEGIGQWTQGACGGWSVQVDQGHFGHPARKATWLYAHGVPSLPSLPSLPFTDARCLVSWCGNHVKSTETRPRIGKRAAAATPRAFAKLLLSIARSTRAPGDAMGGVP